MIKRKETEEPRAADSLLIVQQNELRWEAGIENASHLQLADHGARQEFSIPIDRTMKLQDIQEAHLIPERGGLAGKIVLVPWSAADQ